MLIEINLGNNYVPYRVSIAAVNKLCQHSRGRFNGTRFMQFAHTPLHCSSIKFAVNKKYCHMKPVTNVVI